MQNPVRGPFAAFPRNTRNSLRLEPLWALFGGVIFYFAPLYMKELGLTEIEMGWVTSLGLLGSFFFLLLAGPITNKYGRHLTCLVWDVVSWTVSMLLWSLAQNTLWFLVAVLFNSAARITMVAWNLLVTEDAPEAQQVKIFAWVTILGALGGFVSLVAGLLLDTFGVIPTMRATYGLGAVFMTSMFVIRYFFTQETANGARVRELSRQVPLMRLVIDQGRSLWHAARDSHFAVLSLVFIINMAVQSFTFFQILRLRETLGYTNTELAIIPAVNSLLTLVLFGVVIPRIAARAERLGLALSFLLCAASATGFLFLGSDMLVVVLAVQGLGAAAYVLLATYRDAVFMNSVPEAKKAELYSLLHMISMVVSIPTGVLAGWMYTWNPLAPFIAVVVLFGLGFLSSLALMRRHTSA